MADQNDNLDPTAAHSQESLSSSAQAAPWTTPTLRVLAVSDTKGGASPGGPGEGTFYKVS